MKKNHLISHLITSSLLFFLFACTNSDIIDALPDNRPDYKQSKSINQLEIPPDLTQSSLDDSLQVPELRGADNISLTMYTDERESINQADYNPFEQGLKNIHRQGDSSWIQLNEKPQVVWKQLLNYWNDRGILLVRRDEAIGIMETDWLERRSNMPSGAVQSLIGKIFSGLYDDGHRDMYRTRIDYDGETTYVYLTHYGASEEAVDAAGDVVRTGGRLNNNADITFAWVADQRDPELEIEMLRRLSLYFSKLDGQEKIIAAESKDALTPGKLRVTNLDDGTPALVIQGDFNQAWTILGIAIDRAGYEINQQDRKNGQYNVAKIDIKEIGLIFPEEEKTVTTYDVGLADMSDQQVVVVKSINKEAADPNASLLFLQNISKEIKF